MICSGCNEPRVEYVGLCSRVGDPSNPFDCACTGESGSTGESGKYIIFNWGNLVYDKELRDQIVADLAAQRFNYNDPKRCGHRLYKFFVTVGNGCASVCQSYKPNSFDHGWICSR